MARLTVVQHGDVLVVDSRLIAQDLDIEHRSFVKTLDKYKTQIESGFGVLRFEIAKPHKGTEGGRPTRFAWLTEDQSTFVMTLSRNTERVVECKMRLVKAFSEAKKTIQQVIPAQQQELEKLKLELEVARAKERVLARVDMLSLAGNAPLAALALGQPNAVVEIERPVTVITDAHGRSQRYDGFSITQLAKQYGFGKGKKANDRCRAWIASLGITEGDWIEEPAAHVTRKLPRRLLGRLDAAFTAGKGDRQKLLGERG